MRKISVIRPAIKKQNNVKLIIDAISKVATLEKNYSF